MKWKVAGGEGPGREVTNHPGAGDFVARASKTHEGPRIPSISPEDRESTIEMKLYFLTFNWVHTENKGNLSIAFRLNADGVCFCSSSFRLIQVIFPGAAGITDLL